MEEEESTSLLDLRIEECPSSLLSRTKSHRPAADKPPPMSSTRGSTAATLKPPVNSSPSKTSTSRNVLDEKGRLMLQVLQDYGPYAPQKDYSCRSLPKPRQDDFILRHNAQNIHDFKKEYSKRFGTLNRRPPQFQMDAHQYRVSVATHHEPLWKETDEKAVWTLTDRGHHTLVQGNSTSMPRATITLPALSQRKLVSPFKDKAAVGHHVDLFEDSSYAALVRQQLYSPRPVATHSFAKARIPKYAVAQQLTRRPSTSDGLTLLASPPHSPQSRPYSSDYKHTLHWPYSPSSTPKHPPKSPSVQNTFPTSVVEIEPSIVNFHMVTANHTYHFPVKVHNLGTKQERFRIRALRVKNGGVDCPYAVAQYDKEKAKVAPGLRATVTLVVTFTTPGAIQGMLEVETPSGKGGVALIGTVAAT